MTGRAFVLAAAGIMASCFVDGTPYAPKRCPDVVIYMSVDSTATLAADSIHHPEECPE